MQHVCATVRDSICPLCGKNKKYFQNHHIFGKGKWGESKECQIDICAICHATITHGNDEEKFCRDMACIYHNAWKYGIAFLNKEYRDARLTGEQSIFPAFVRNVNEYHSEFKLSDYRWLTQSIRELYRIRYECVRLVIQEGLEKEYYENPDNESFTPLFLKHYSNG